MEKTINTFKKDVKFGKAGEQLVKKYLESQDYVVEDVTQEYLTYDFFVHSKTNIMTIHALEVKHQNCIADGKLCLELEGKYGSLGWFIKSSADKYAFTLENRILFIRATDLMKAYITLKPKQIHTKEGKVIAFVNIDDIKQLVKVADIKI